MCYTLCSTLPKNAKTKNAFLASRANKNLVEGLSPPQELEVTPHSGPFPLVVILYDDPEPLLSPNIIFTVLTILGMVSVSCFPLLSPSRKN